MWQSRPWRWRSTAAPWPRGWRSGPGRTSCRTRQSGRLPCRRGPLLRLRGSIPWSLDGVGRRLLDRRPMLPVQWWGQLEEPCGQRSARTGTWLYPDLRRGGRWYLLKRGGIYKINFRWLIRRVTVAVYHRKWTFKRSTKSLQDPFSRRSNFIPPCSIKIHFSRDFFAHFPK